eukprot:3796189-Pyramimonas_sp.AAC.1
MKTTPLFSDKKHFRVISAAPRWLLVAICAPGLVLNVLVAHAPHSGSGVAARAAFWGEIQRLQDSLGPALTFVDANGRL